MTDPDDLVASPQYYNPHGIGAVDGFQNLSNLVHSLQVGIGEGEWDGFAMTADGLLVGLEALNFAVDPAGSLISAGLEILIEYIEPLRQAVNLITGDPVAVDALSQTWANIAEELFEAANDYESALRDVVTWSGDMANAYRDLAGQVVAALRGTAEMIVDAAKGVLMAGLMVATTRAIILDLLATFITIALASYIPALAASGPTFGGSVAIWLASTVGQLVILLAKVVIKLAALVNASELYSGKFSRLAEGGADLAAAEQALAAHVNGNSGRRPGLDVAV